ncbi:hypothetical protein HZ326_22000 [Fusarium oxysporum f. sp. albedinis]|nr:hypothetical protein HZ326_22000 [Fusarium oxysporum f. sp. albedinis]
MKNVSTFQIYVPRHGIYVPKCLHSGFYKENVVLKRKVEVFSTVHLCNDRVHFKRQCYRTDENAHALYCTQVLKCLFLDVVRKTSSWT